MQIPDQETELGTQKAPFCLLLVTIPSRTTTMLISNGINKFSLVESSTVNYIVWAFFLYEIHPCC